MKSVVKTSCPSLSSYILTDYCETKGVAILKYDTPFARFNAWALSDLTRSTVLAWIYDRSFKANGKPITQKGKQLKCWLRINGTIANQEYVYSWFNTWSGNYIPCVNSVKSNKDGFLHIELPKFPTSNKKAIKGVADGNDIAIRITLAT